MAELAERKTLLAPLGPRLEAVFRCSFADVEGQAYSYDVYWYINEQSVITHRRLAYNNIDQSLLRPAIKHRYTNGV
jgi:DNA topoisomerase IA